MLAELRGEVLPPPKMPEWSIGKPPMDAGACVLAEGLLGRTTFDFSGCIKTIPMKCAPNGVRGRGSHRAA